MQDKPSALSIPTRVYLSAYLTESPRCLTVTWEGFAANRMQSCPTIKPMLTRYVIITHHTYCLCVSYVKNLHLKLMKKDMIELTEQRHGRGSFNSMKEENINWI